MKRKKKEKEREYISIPTLTRGRLVFLRLVFLAQGLGRVGRNGDDIELGKIANLVDTGDSTKEVPTEGMAPVSTLVSGAGDFQ